MFTVSWLGREEDLKKVKGRERREKDGAEQCLLLSLRARHRKPWESER